MLFFLFHYLSNYYHGFDLIQNVVFRGIFSALTAMILMIFFGSPLIRKLQKLQIGQVIRKEGPESHSSKKGTPTMGGVLVLLTITVSVLMWSDLSSIYTWVLLLVLLSYGLIGFLDDFLKIFKKNPQGLKAKYKYAMQSAFAIVPVLIMYFYFDNNMEINLVLPYTKNLYLPLGAGFLILGYFVIVGSSNAVNLTDGLDGLVAMPVVMVALALGIFAYISSNATLSDHLLLPYIPGTQEVVIFCTAIAGATIGFLWFNSYPAEIFLGDVGALALGAVLGMIALILRQEIVFFIMSMLFVIETLSVVLQVGSYKLRNGKRIFKMAPIHHHFELKGWPEPKVVIRFWIFAAIFVLIALASIKIR